MPLDIVKVQKSKSGQACWLLRESGMEFSAASLFRGAWGSLASEDIVDGLDVEYDVEGNRVANVRRYPPLPDSTRRLVAHRGCDHPGLALDKLVYRYSDQNLAKASLKKVVEVNERQHGECQRQQNHWYRRLFERWQQVTARLGEDSLQFRCTTTGPLTLHLARASALENAGICLHPLYGFVYLPGTGLKGMARAYAETVAQARDEEIAAVFGDTESAGSIVFHDAWPTQWPSLIVDILNNHHPSYYQSDDEATGHPPGDWENPVPVNFLAVPPGTEFAFALGSRRGGGDPEALSLLSHARDWLIGALCHLGAGAKTAAGYGAFQLSATQSVSPSPFRGIWTGALEGEQAGRFEAIVQFRLVSPAFLGGPDRNASDTPRLSSLRGVLRSWWRAWHGDLTIGQLREREGSVLGSLRGGSALVVMPPKRQRLKILRASQDMGSGGSPLGYLGYGPIAYEKNVKKNRTQLAALDAAQAFEVRLVHRTRAGLEEVLKSAWLLGAIGGIGARSRRAWGAVSLRTDLGALGLPVLSDCKSIDEYRQALMAGLERLAPSAQRKSATETQWTAITRETRVVLSRKLFGSWREAMEDLGNRFQQFRRRDTRGGAGPRDGGEPGPDYRNTKDLLTKNGSSVKSVPERAGFGMPYAQEYGSLGRARASFTPVWKEGRETIEGRRASPLFCKVVELATGKFLWQVVWLPAQFLPEGAMIDGKGSGRGSPPKLPNSPYPPPGPFGVVRNAEDPTDTLIREFLDWLEEPKASQGVRQGSAHAAERTASGRAATTPGTAPPAGEIKKPPASAPKPVNKGQTRPGTLRRRGERWVAVFEGDDRDGIITNPENLPPDLQEGTKAEFYIQLASKKEGIRARFNRLL